MHYKKLGEELYARARAVPINPALTFALEGLALGAGTVLLQADGPRRLPNLSGQEARVLALLSAFHGRPVALSALGNIERAAKSWNDGDPCLAYIHLAHAMLQEPDGLPSAACRLVVADRAMEAGVSPRAIFQALKATPLQIVAVGKLYNPDEPRVSAGSGRASGEWTDGDQSAADATAGGGTAESSAQSLSVLARMPLPESSFLGELDASQVTELGAYASRLLSPPGAIAAAAAAVFGLLFIPSPNSIRVEGEVPEIPGLHYSWNRDETVLHLTYDRGGAQRAFALQVDGDFIRDDNGQVVGRVIGGNRIAIDTFAVLPDLVKEDEPRLCPAPAPDVAGSDQGKPHEENRSRQYENFVKLLINPPPKGPTPSGFVYYLPNPQDGNSVSYDDCKWTNGTFFEIKGEGLANLVEYLPDELAIKFIKQAVRQLAASGGRPVVWVFAKEQAAWFARGLFDSAGLGRITVVHIPWIRSAR